MKKTVIDKLDFYDIKKEVEELSKTLQKPIKSELEYKYSWICRNLSVYKNCFINDKTMQMIDFDIIKRILKVDKINIEPEEITELSVSYGAHGFILSI